MPAVRKMNEVVTAYTGGLAVSPHDTNELATWSRGLWIGTSSAGELKVTMVDGQEIVFTNLAVGFYPFAVKKVWSTGTTVSDITAVW